MLIISYYGKTLPCFLPCCQLVPLKFSMDAVESVGLETVTHETVSDCVSCTVRFP